MFRTLGVLAVIGCTILSGCYFDHRKKIAYETLFSEKGWPDSLAFTEALSAKFPKGSPAGALEAFVAKLDGTCGSGAPDRLHCTIPTRGMYCAVSVLSIRATLESGNLTSIKVVATGGGC